MSNIIRAQKGFEHKVFNYTISNYFVWFDKGELMLDPMYQRDYVWTAKEQQAFLKALMSGFPIGHVSLVEDQSDCYEVVDGKQRLTTLHKFYKSEIPFICDGKNYYYKDLDAGEQRAFKNMGLPAILLQVDNEKDKIQYFADVNFAGVPQSEEHKEKVLKMLETM